MRKIILVTIILLCTVTTTVSAQFVHPGVIFNTEDLDRMKNNINVEPWKTGYEIILDDEKSSFNYQMQGPAEIVDRNGQNFGQFNNDADAIYYQSIQYYITGDNRYAESAVEMIEAWASTITHIGGNVPALAAADRGLRILTGCEILRYTYSGWTNNLSNITEDFAREVLLPPLYLPDITRVANQGASQIDAVIALSVYINDKVLFDQAINAFLNEPCAGITNTTASGMNGDTGRDYGHAFGMANNLASAAESAYKQGVDLFSVLDNRVLAITEYWNAYGLGVDVPFTPYGTCYDYFETIGSNGRGNSDFNTNKLLEIVQGAYTVRKGIPSPYTTERINDIPASEHTFFFKKDGSDNTGATVPGAPYGYHTGTTNNSLTNVKIGGGSTGSSNFNGNTWTIVGNGDVYGISDSDGCQFAYHQLDREGTIIAKINSISSSNSNAKVGLMFRESLDADSRMFAAYAHNSGGLETTFRNQSVVNTDNVPASQINLNSFDEVNFSEGWVKIEINEGRVSGFYSVDKVIWVPLGTAIFNNLNNMYLGLFAGSHDNANGTGVFSDVEVLTNESTSTGTSSSFTPDPNKTYYIDAPYHNLRLAASGESEDAYTTSTNTTGNDVEWKFVSKGNGNWHIQRAAGGTKSRLRTDNTDIADMQPTDWNGTYTYYEFSEGYIDNTYFITLPNGPSNYQRLQINNDGVVRFVTTDHALTWESFTITEAGNLANFSKIEAEDYDAMSGIQTENSTENGENVGWINNDDWLRFDNIDLTAAQSVAMRIACNFEGGTIEVRTGSLNGTLIGSIDVVNTGGNQNWVTLNTNISNVNGSQDVYLVFKGGNGYLFNINWLEFSASSVSEKSIANARESINVSVYPNPIIYFATISIEENYLNENNTMSIVVYNISGKKIEEISTDKLIHTIDMRKYNSGVYLLDITDGINKESKRVVKY